MEFWIKPKVELSLQRKDGAKAVTRWQEAGAVIFDPLGKPLQLADWDSQPTPIIFPPDAQDKYRRGIV